MAGKGSKIVKCMQNNMLPMLTFAGVIGGGAIGFILKSSKEKWTPREVMYVQFVGDIFLRMLKCLIIPLLVSSIVTAIGSLDLSLSKKIGFRAIVYYTTTTYLAVIQGIILVTVIRPGDGESQAIKQTVNTRNVTTIDTIMDLIRNMFPENLIQACTQQFRTKLTFHPGQIDMNISDPYSWELGSEYSHGSNVLGLVIFSIVLGIAIGKMGELGKPLLSLFKSLGEAMMVITNWVICSAALPISMSCLEEKNKCDPRVSRFVMPIGATINMDGAALYEAVAPIFIAQLRRIPLSFGQMVAVSIAATMASIGAAAIPQSALVTMVMVLDTVGLPAEDVTLILAVDWLLDRFRTLINVEGDSLGAGLVEHLSKDELRAMDKTHHQTKQNRKISAPHTAGEAQLLNSGLI